jgi:hypothetical protein
MRHVTGFFLALILAAAIFAGGGYGVQRVQALQHGGGSLAGITGLLGWAALVGTGLLLGLTLAAPAISPLAAGLPGLALLGWTALLAVRASRAIALIPLRGYDISVGFHAMLTSGILAMLGMAMIIPLFVPSRWHRRGYHEDIFAPRAEAGLLQ